MNIERLFGTIINFLSSNSIITLIIIVVIVLIAYKKPKQVIKAVIIFLFFCVVVYAGIYLQDAFFTGVEYKGDIIEKQENY